MDVLNWDAILRHSPPPPPKGNSSPPSSGGNDRGGNPIPTPKMVRVLFSELKMASRLRDCVGGPRTERARGDEGRGEGVDSWPPPPPLFQVDLADFRKISEAEDRGGRGA